MVKAYEKDKRLLGTEKERSIHFQQTSPSPHIAVNDTNKNLESTSNETCHSREQTRNVETGYHKIGKVKKTWDHQPRKHRERR